MRYGYHRPAYARLVWGAVVALALALALWFAARATADAIRQDERQRVLTEGHELLEQALAEGQRLAGERDSLRVLVGQRDTLLIERIVQAKQEAALPIPPASDTSALVAAVRSCRATLDTLATECEAFRAMATAALAKADTSAQRDAAVMAGLTMQLAVIRRDDSTKAARAQRASKWRTVERGVCVGSLAANVFTFSR